MGQTTSKPHFPALSSNSWRRLSDSDCLHLLSHPEYFENDILDGKTRAFDDSHMTGPPRPSSASTFCETGADGSGGPVVIRSISLASNGGGGGSPTPVRRNPMAYHHRQIIARPTARLRPISMFTFEDHADQKPTVTAGNDPSETSPSPPSLKQIENMNLSLNDFLEQANATDLMCRAPPPVRLRGRGRGPRRNNGGPRKPTPRKTNEELKTSDSTQTLVAAPEMEKPNAEDSKSGEPETGDRHRPGAGGPIRCSGLDCMCDRCLQSRFKLLNWLLPNCTRMNSERLLSGKPDGTFLVRKSEKFPGQYTLSFVCRRAVRHCLIMRSVYGFGLRWPYSFETLQQVILHYTRHSLTEFNSKLNIHLKYPVFTA